MRDWTQDEANDFLERLGKAIRQNLELSAQAVKYENLAVRAIDNAKRSWRWTCGLAIYTLIQTVIAVYLLSGR